MTNIGIIIGTNRSQSFTMTLGHFYQNELKKRDITANLLDLTLLPPDFAFSALYDNIGKNPEFEKFQSFIDQHSKLVFIIPEYNGSFPGVLKTFIDGLRFPDSFANKKIALVGLSTGVQGNTLGLSHFADILSYLNANVLGLRVKLGLVEKNFENGAFTLPSYHKFIQDQIEQLCQF